MAGFFQAVPYAEEQQRIQQNLLYAQQLQQQGLKPLQGQMVGNQFVRPSLTQGISKVASAYLGKREQDRALDKYHDLSDKALNDQTTAMHDILSEPDPAQRVQAALSSPIPAVRQLGNTLMADMLARGQIDYRSSKRIDEIKADPSKLDFEQRKELAAIKPNDPNALTFEQRKELARARGGAQGSAPYFTTQAVVGPDGKPVMVVTNARDGTTKLMDVNGNPVTKTTDSPEVRGAVSEATGKGTALGKAEAGNVVAEPQRARTREQLTGMLDELSNHPGFESIYGTVAGRTPTLMQSSVDAEARRDQIVSMLSLENRSKLVGQGAISDFESKMLGKSATKLADPKISPAEAAKEIAYVKEQLANPAARVGVETKQSDAGDLTPDEQAELEALRAKHKR